MKQKFHQQQQTDSSSSLDEAIVIQDDEEEVIEHHPSFDQPDETQLFRLKSSGRIIRNIDQAPAKEKRTWLTPQQQQRLQRLLQKNHRSWPTVTQLNQRRLIGELLHILRPIIHLTTGTIVGGFEDHWTPYLVSLGLDVISLRLLRGS
ncbi:peroxisomal membrane protein PEX16-like protein, partial [Euroglyphus maynei]